MWWMRILLTDTVIESRGAIVRAKNPKVRKALFGLPAAIKALDIRLPLTGSDVERIAAHLNIGEREIEEALVHAAGDVMLDEPIGDGSMVRGDVMQDDRADGEDSIIERLTASGRWDAVCEALMNLPARDRFILITRYLLSPKWKLDRLSDTLKMSRERIRQIGVDGLTRIRHAASAVGTMPVPGRQGHPQSVAAVAGGPCKAAAEVAALVNAIERASASTDPETMTAFLRDQRLAIGPTRITRSRPAGMETLPGAVLTGSAAALHEAICVAA
jgi:hypothetical protein